jgi:hypothetical protein
MGTHKGRPARLGRLCRLARLCSSDSTTTGRIAGHCLSQTEDSE